MGRGLDQTLFVQVRDMRTIGTIKMLWNLSGFRKFLLVVFIASHDESIRDRQWSLRPTFAAIVDRDSRPNIVAPLILGATRLISYFCTWINQCTVKEI